LLANAPPLSSRRDEFPSTATDSLAPSIQPGPTAIQPTSTFQWTSLRALAAAPPLSSRQNDAPSSSSTSHGSQTATRRTTQRRSPTPFPGQSTSTSIPASHPSSRPLATATDPSLVTSQATAVGPRDLVPSPIVDRYSRRPRSHTTANSTASSSDSTATSTHDSDHRTHGRHPRLRDVSDTAAAAPSHQPATSPVQPISLRALAAAPPLSSRQTDTPSGSRGSRTATRQTVQRRPPTPFPGQSTSTPASHQPSRSPATATDPFSVTSQATAVRSEDLVPTAGSFASSSSPTDPPTQPFHNRTHNNRRCLSDVSNTAAATPSHQPASTFQWNSLRALAAAPPLSSRQDDTPSSSSSSSRGPRAEPQSSTQSQRRLPTPLARQSTSLPSSNQPSRPPATATDPSSVTSQATPAGPQDPVTRSTTTRPSRNRTNRARGQPKAPKASTQPAHRRNPSRSASLSQRIELLNRS